MKKTYFAILLVLLLGTMGVSAQPYFTRNGMQRPADNRHRHGGGY